MVLKNLGNGIVLFENVIDVDQDYVIPYLRSLKEEAIQKDYTIIYDDQNTPLYAINRSGHRYSFEDIDLSCSHIMNFATPDKEEGYVNFFRKCEDKIYECLLDYIELFPMILPCLWWRTQGHVVAYSPGSYFGLHCDNDVNYQPGAIPDQQLAIRNVVGAIIYLNDSFCLGEEKNKHGYLGGEIVFPYAGVEYSPKAGDIIMFPSNYLAAHEVKTCREGYRFGYVGYFAQGSPDLERGINIRDSSDIMDSGQVWMPELFDDYRKKIISKYSNNKEKMDELLRPSRRANTSSGTNEEVTKQISQS
jgi:hypothetical protein